MNKFQIFGIAVIAAAVGLSACTELARPELDTVAQPSISTKTQPTTEASNSSPQDSTSDGSIDFDESLGKFTVAGKPTKTIDTPWGPREVYDPTQDPKLREDFKGWYYHPDQISYSEYSYGVARKISRLNEAKGTSIKERDRSIRFRFYARRLQGLDYARHQCMRQTYSGGCREEDFVFKEPCLTDHNLHSEDLSECEKENYAPLWSSGPKCDWSTDHLIYYEALRGLSFEDALYAHYARVCDVWRGQPGDDYWEKELSDGSRLRPYRSLVPRNARKKVKLIQRKKQGE